MLLPLAGKISLTRCNNNHNGRVERRNAFGETTEQQLRVVRTALYRHIQNRTGKIAERVATEWYFSLDMFLKFCLTSLLELGFCKFTSCIVQ